MQHVRSNLTAIVDFSRRRCRPASKLPTRFQRRTLVNLNYLDSALLVGVPVLIECGSRIDCDNVQSLQALNDYESFDIRRRETFWKQPLPDVDAIYLQGLVVLQRVRCDGKDPARLLADLGLVVFFLGAHTGWLP